MPENQKIPENRKQSSGRTMHPDANWRAKMEKARENDAEHTTSEHLVQLLWEQRFGPVAVARMLDWYCSCHPDNRETQETNSK